MEHRNGGREVPGSGVAEGNDGIGGLVHHHLRLVAQHGLQELHEPRLPNPRVLFLNEASHDTNLWEANWAAGVKMPHAKENGVKMEKIGVKMEKLGVKMEKKGVKMEKKMGLRWKKG